MSGKCPVCLNIYLGAAQVTRANGRLRVDCDVCGQFALSEEVWADRLNPEIGAGHMLSHLCRSRISHRLVTGTALSTGGRNMLTREYLDNFIADGCPGPTPSEQANNIIKYVGDEVSRSGVRIETLPASFYARSDERRVGKEGGGTCRSRWSQYH